MNIGFSLFRIMAGIPLLISGYDKLIKLIKVNFDPNQFGLLQWFLSIFHGEKTQVSSHVAIFFPKFSIYILSYLVPFWEILAGLLLILGICKCTMKIGASLAIALMAVFLMGAQAMIAVDNIIEMFVMGTAYFLVYVGLVKEFEDPLSIARFRALCSKNKQSK